MEYAYADLFEWGSALQAHNDATKIETVNRGTLHN